MRGDAPRIGYRIRTALKTKARGRTLVCSYVGHSQDAQPPHLGILLRKNEYKKGG